MVIGILIGVLLFLVYASASIRSGIYLKVVCRIDTDEKIMALTFDDGPDHITTPKILDVLLKYNIKVVFFCIGQKMEGQEALLRRMANEGHMIGNHSHDHGYFFPLLSRASVKKDIQKCEMRIQYITGQQRLSLFRPPFGVTNPTVAKTMTQLGYRTLGWDVRSFDTVKKKYQNVVKRVNRKIKPGSIILLHDTTPAMPVILEDIINYAQQQGYRFVRADQYL
jgi:peptidoglycan/xylan/chitin deacetylase (PgdA/CDA1 family)